MSWDEARALGYDGAVPLTPVAVPVSVAAGLVLAEDLHSLVDLPSFDVSAMDGWALRGDGPWRVVGAVLAGALWDTALADGEAVEIATGAAVPVGAEWVLPVERGVVVGQELQREGARGRHIRRTGEEVAAGSLLLPGGTVLSPSAVGLAAATGHDELVVHPRPRVAAVVTGSELLAAGLPGDGRIRDAIGPLLAGAVPSLGGVLTSTVLLPDDRAGLQSALGADADVVVVSGSSSVGPADHLVAVLRDLGAQVLVDGVDVRPGHPQLLARLPGGTWVVGLPGNPLAALVGLVTLAGPLLTRLAGRPRASLHTAILDLSDLHGPLLSRTGLRSTGLLAVGTGGATRLVPVRLVGDRAMAVGHDGSAMLLGAATADALAVCPPMTVDGDRVDVVLLP